MMTPPAPLTDTATNGQISGFASPTPDTTTPPVAHPKWGGALAPEQRAKSAATRAANAAARAASPLRRDFLDDQFWQDLASRYNVRLPAWGVPITSGAIERWLRKLGLTIEWYRDEWSGERNLSDFAKRNPRWPLRAWVGLMLEEREHDDAHRQVVPA